MIFYFTIEAKVDVSAIGKAVTNALSKKNDIATSMNSAIKQLQQSKLISSSEATLFKKYSTACQKRSKSTISDIKKISTEILSQKNLSITAQNIAVLAYETSSQTEALASTSDVSIGEGTSIGAAIGGAAGMIVGAFLGMSGGPAGVAAGAAAGAAVGAGVGGVAGAAYGASDEEENE